MKMILGKDERYPIYGLEGVRESWGTQEVEVSAEFVEECRKINFAWEDMQDRLEALDTRSRGG